jgi:hypothetical protein
VAFLKVAAARLVLQVPGARRRRGLESTVVSTGPSTLPDASATQNHLGAAVAAPPTVSYLARAAGGRLLGSLDHQQTAELHAGKVP